MVRRESRSSTIGHINLDTKQTGAPSAGNLHAGCDVAGTGNGFTVGLVRHSQRKRGETARPDLRNTAPVLDPTGQCSLICIEVNRLCREHTAPTREGAYSSQPTPWELPTTKDIITYNEVTVTHRMKIPVWARQSLTRAFLRSGPVTLGPGIRLRSHPGHSCRPENKLHEDFAKLRPIVSCHW